VLRGRKQGVAAATVSEPDEIIVGYEYSPTNPAGREASFCDQIVQ